MASPTMARWKQLLGVWVVTTATNSVVVQYGSYGGMGARWREVLSAWMRMVLRGMKVIWLMT